MKHLIKRYIWKFKVWLADKNTHEGVTKKDKWRSEIDNTSRHK